jgi:uncharacterized membrane protein YdjX (TVP38/TMEM64 family)
VKRGIEGRAAMWLVASVAASMGLIYLTPLREYLDLERAAEVIAFARGLGVFGPLCYLVITALGVMLGAPRLFFAGLGGYVFGFWPGFLAAQVGTLIGSVSTFLYCRALGRPYVERRLGPRFDKLSSLLDYLGNHGLLANILVRNIPIGNSFMMTLAMSVSPMPLRIFALGTFIGTAPEAAIAAWSCDAGGGAILRRLAVAAALVAVLAGTCFLILRKSRLRRALAAAGVVAEQAEAHAGERSSPRDTGDPPLASSPPR